MHRVNMAHVNLGNMTAFLSAFPSATYLNFSYATLPSHNDGDEKMNTTARIVDLSSTNMTQVHLRSSALLELYATDNLVKENNAHPI